MATWPSSPRRLPRSSSRSRASAPRRPPRCSPRRATIPSGCAALRSEAAFARLCGVAPLPASSGKTTRHRLSRGGNRDANRALSLLALGRLSWDPRTRAYAARRTAEGLSTPEILRCLKRSIAREVYRLLVRAPTTPASVSGVSLAT